MDYHMRSQGNGYGVGLEILEKSAFEVSEIDSTLTLLELRRKFHGDGVVALDCGANIGTHTIEWARRMTGWGSVVAFEAQERVYYALAGNIAINNCFNARAIHAAVAEKDGSMTIPVPDYLSPGSFGSLELKKRENPEFIGQTIDYAGPNMAVVRMLALDSLKLPRVDFIKIDVEGMELEVLDGATNTIRNSSPILLVEAIKVDQNKLRLSLESFGYQVFRAGQNFLAVHKADKAGAHVAVRS